MVRRHPRPPRPPGAGVGPDRRPLHGRLGDRDPGHPPPRAGAGRGPHGQLQRGTAWEKAITTVERDLARLDHAMPPLYCATETLRYLPNHDLQDDAVVETWLSLLGTSRSGPTRAGSASTRPAWPGPPISTAPRRGRPSRCPAWSWPSSTTSTRRRPGPARPPTCIPGARFVEIPGASHLGIFTHGPEVGQRPGRVLRRPLTAVPLRPDPAPRLRSPRPPRLRPEDPDGPGPAARTRGPGR